MLLGLVSNFISINKIAPVSYENNSGLCGGPLNFCNQHIYCVFEVSFKNGFVVSFAILAFSLILLFPCLISGKMQENEVENFQLWVSNHVCFSRKQSKRKWKEKRKMKDTKH